MSIFDRIQRIARANVNWLLDRADSPEQQLESHIAELESALREGRECAASYGATCKRMDREAEQIGRRQAEYLALAEQALAAGDEPAARRALDEKVRLAERLAHLEPGLLRGRQTYGQLRENLLTLQDQLQAARLRLSELRARQRAAHAHKTFAQRLDGVPGQTGAFGALEDQVLQAEAEVEAREELRAASLDEATLQDRSHQWQVEAELQALRERLTPPGQ